MKKKIHIYISIPVRSSSYFPCQRYSSSFSGTERDALHTLWGRPRSWSASRGVSVTDREPLRTNSAARLGRGEQENNYCLTNYCCRRESSSFVSTCPNLHKRVSNLKEGGGRGIIYIYILGDPSRNPLPSPPSSFCSIYLRHNRRTNYRKKKKIRSFARLIEHICSSRYRRVSCFIFPLNLPFASRIQRVHIYIWQQWHSTVDKKRRMKRLIVVSYRFGFLVYWHDDTMKERPWIREQYTILARWRRTDDKSFPPFRYLERRRRFTNEARCGTTRSVMREFESLEMGEKEREKKDKTRRDKNVGLNNSSDHDLSIELSSGARVSRFLLISFFSLCLSLSHSVCRYDD